MTAAGIPDDATQLATKAIEDYLRAFPIGKDSGYLGWGATPEELAERALAAAMPALVGAWRDRAHMAENQRLSALELCYPEIDRSSSYSSFAKRIVAALGVTGDEEGQ